MNGPELEKFETAIRGDAELSAIIDRAAAAGEEQRKEAAKHRMMGAGTALGLICVVALWKLAKVGIDHLRRMSENAALEKRMEIARQVVAETGASLAEVIAAIESLMKDIKTRDDADAVTEAIMRMFKAAGGDPGE